MQLIKSINSVKKQIRKAKKTGKSIGLVPTMGYFHEGHLSLIRKAVKECDVVVISIFVNPAQFGPGEDYLRYPRELSRDLHLAEEESVNIVFAPSAKSMYPNGYQAYVNVEKMSKVLCGISRPSHFRGVVSVVAKLFNIIEPDIAYFGGKDAQQAIIVDRMVKDLNMNVKLKVLPIIREKDGLAMSSRNTYLNKMDRKNAANLYKSLKGAKRLINSGTRDTNRIIHTMRKMIKSVPHAQIDYISVVDAKGLKPVKRLKGKILIALAVYFGKTRLIDNIIVRL
ncbi:MAG: pantoate--beta-alanine ligase [Candidatus Omnitrophota bacterium]|nr:MAG: pantoate--beta-alanine ligase [Candidatus Omnitrophota bacterium]